MATELIEITHAASSLFTYLRPGLVDCNPT